MDETDDVSGALCLCVCVYMKKKVKGRQRNSCSFGYTYGTMIYLYLRNNGDNDLFRNSCSFGYTERYWSDTLTEQWYIYTYGTMIYLLPLGTLRGTGATRPLTCPGSRLKEQSALASSSVVVGDALEIWRAHGSHFYSPKLFCILPYPCAYPSPCDTYVTSSYTYDVTHMSHHHTHIPQTLCILPYPCAYPSCRDTAR